MASPDANPTPQAESDQDAVDYPEIIGGKGISRRVSLIPLSVANFRVADHPGVGRFANAAPLLASNLRKCSASANVPKWRLIEMELTVQRARNGVGGKTTRASGL
jgi:hypothetical protein